MNNDVQWFANDSLLHQCTKQKQHIVSMFASQMLLLVLQSATCCSCFKLSEQASLTGSAETFSGRRLSSRIPLQGYTH